MDGRAEPYVGMTNEEVARLVLALLLEELLAERLADYRAVSMACKSDKEIACAS